MNIRMLICLILLLASSLSIASAQETEQELTYDNASSPVDVIASYYNAIALGDYQRAYHYWSNHPKSFTSFAAGFADTLSVQLIVQPPTRIGAAAGSVYSSIPTVVIAEHRDNTQHIYSGCFVTRKSNIQTPDMPEDHWHINTGTLVEVFDISAIPTLLAESCDP